jgi:hypothetical protein
MLNAAKRAGNRFPRRHARVTRDPPDVAHTRARDIARGTAFASARQRHPPTASWCDGPASRWRTRSTRTRSARIGRNVRMQPYRIGLLCGATRAAFGQLLSTVSPAQRISTAAVCSSEWKADVQLNRLSAARNARAVPTGSRNGARVSCSLGEEQGYAVRNPDRAHSTRASGRIHVCVTGIAGRTHVSWMAYRGKVIGWQANRPLF